MDWKEPRRSGQECYAFSILDKKHPICVKIQKTKDWYGFNYTSLQIHVSYGPGLRGLLLLAKLPLHSDEFVLFGSSCIAHMIELELGVELRRCAAQRSFMTMACGRWEVRWYWCHENSIQGSCWGFGELRVLRIFGFRGIYKELWILSQEIQCRAYTFRCRALLSRRE